jgi:carbonic anhydrase
MSTALERNEPRIATGSATSTRRSQPAASFASRLAQRADAPPARDAAATLPHSDPALSLALLTCMDARLDIAGGLGISIGDAHILRNAGGRVTDDVIRSLLVSVKLMNVREIGILHHTRCGLHGTDNDALTRKIGVSGRDYLPFQSFDDSLSADVAAILRERILPAGGIVWGALYSLEAKKISLVHGPTVVTAAGDRG